VDFSHLQGRGEFVAIVDDEEAVLLVTEQALKRFGYATKIFNSTARFLKSFPAAGSGVDLLITDLTMPGISGLELTRKLRASGQELPVLLMTGFSKHLRPKSVEGLGKVSLLRKPFTTVHLAQSVRRALTISSAA
jgi:FixJ family two-component response regulator